MFLQAGRGSPASIALTDRHLHRESIFQLRVDRDAVRDRGLLDVPDPAGTGDERREALVRTQGARAQTHFHDAFTFIDPHRTKTRRRSRECLTIALEVPDAGDAGHSEDVMPVSDPREVDARVTVLPDQLDGR